MAGDMTVEALGAFDDELKCWRVTPARFSQWNDNGVIRYRKYHVERVPPLGETDLSATPASEAVVDCHVLDDGFAQQYPRLRAMQAALLAAKV